MNIKYLFTNYHQRIDKYLKFVMFSNFGFQ